MPEANMTTNVVWEECKSIDDIPKFIRFCRQIGFNIDINDHVEINEIDDGEGNISAEVREVTQLTISRNGANMIVTAPDSKFIYDGIVLYKVTEQQFLERVGGSAGAQQ